MPPPAEGRTSRGVGGGGGGVAIGEEQAREAVASLGTQRNTDLHVGSQATASSPLKAIQVPGHLGHSGGQHLGNPGGQEVSAPGRARPGP